MHELRLYSPAVFRYYNHTVLCYYMSFLLYTPIHFYVDACLLFCKIVKLTWGGILNNVRLKFGDPR